MLSRISSFQVRRRRLLAAASLIAAVAVGGADAFAGEIHHLHPGIAADRADEGEPAMRAMRTAQLEWLFGPFRPERAPAYDNNGYGDYRNGGREIRAPRQYRPYGARVERTHRLRRLSNAALRRKMEERSQRLVQRRRELAARNAPDIWRGGFTRARVAARLKASELPPPAKGPLLVTVSIDRQKLTLYDEGVPIAETRVSTGIRGRETPLGVFSVLQKEQWHRSNLYGNAPMPYMQRLTWDGIALHGGVVPPYPASHGCIRIPEKFAIRLWNTTQRGARVIVSQAAVKPVEISHPLLFRSRAEPAPVPEGIPPQPLPTPPQAKLDRDGERSGDAAAHAVAAAPEEIAAYLREALAGDTPSLQDEIERTIPAIAEIAVGRGGQPVELVSIAPPAGKMMRAASALTPAAAPAPRKMALREVTIIRGGRATEVRTIEMPAEPEETVADKPADAAVARNARGRELPIMIAYGGADAAELVARLDPRLAQSLGGTVPDTQDAAALASAPGASPAPVAADPVQRAGKLSVFISRAARRIYVRKGFRAVFDMPVTIAMPRRPMGTYVFTANALNGSDRALRWTAVAVGDRGEGRQPDDTDRSDVEDALRALDRIELPKEATEKLAQMVGVGASIIVSDKWPVKPGATDDFSVILKAAPQSATLMARIRGRSKVRR